MNTEELQEFQICPIRYAMQIIGSKWKIPILWHLADEGTLRYNQLKKGIKDITNIMLTQSLRELEEDGMIIRHQYNEVPPKVEYYLSERGKTLIPILYSLHAWGKEQLEITQKQK